MGDDATMTARTVGITMLDAAALVTGGAVASVHFREFDEEMAGLGVLGWSLVVPGFAWLALTAAGPFVFLVRRVGRRPDGYPEPDDLLWLALGLPWVVAALAQSAAGGLAHLAPWAYNPCLFLGLSAATAPALVRLARSLPRIDPIGTGPTPGPIQTTDRPWTARIGLAVAVAWPIQFALWLAVTR